jgi:hypothetical protein
VNWSLILPSRRPALLRNLLQSLTDTTADPANLEVLIAFDYDDKPMVGEVCAITRRFRFARFAACDRQTNFSDGYYNRLAAEARGRFIQAMNDDVTYLTPGWDTLAGKAMDDYAGHFKDGMAYGKFQEVGVGLGDDFACFPVLTREAYEALGWFFHRDFWSWNADVHLQKVFGAIDRCVALPAVIEHQQDGTDELNQRIRLLSTCNMNSIPLIVWQLKRYIAKGTKPWS